MFNLQPGAPAPRCDGADSKAWGIAQRDSLSFLDHGISPAAAAVIPRRSTVPDLQTARSWGSLASQTLAMYPEVRPSDSFNSAESASAQRRLRESPDECVAPCPVS